MLYTTDGKKMTKVPHYEKFKAYSSRINKEDMNKIVDYLNEVVANEKVFNSSFIPPKNWTGSVFQPIYDLIRDEQLSAFLYGQILWQVIMDDDKKWMFQQADNTLGKIYFLVENPELLSD